MQMHTCENKNNPYEKAFIYHFHVIVCLCGNIS